MIEMDDDGLRRAQQENEHQRCTLFSYLCWGLVFAYTTTKEPWKQVPSRQRWGWIESTIKKNKDWLPDDH